MKTIEELNDAIRAFQASRVLLTGIELDVFQAVGAGATSAEVAQLARTDPRATGVLLDALAALGLLSKQGDVYHNTEVAARHLTAGSPEDARGAFMHTTHLWQRWSSLTQSVRTGRPAQPPEEGEGPGAEDARTRAFISAMHRNALERAPHVMQVVDLDGVRRMLDLGGGSGAYSIVFAQANPGLRSELLDLASVLPLTRAYVQAAGLADRVAARPGDIAQESYGSGYDLVWISQICHMFGESENRAMLRKAHAALERGGRVVIQDFILDPDRTSPPHAALFAINMLVGTTRGTAYTEAEYAAWLADAGFCGVRRIPLPGPSDLIVARR
ncbi:MAG TPA: methyltransferase [Candidatus Saccharimonadales bacterium]|nr:methyltransferase [Candidatus Saccharimonadales bacterium]